MDANHLLQQARKYRVAALSFAPHLASLKSDYEAKASQLESQAHELLTPAETPDITPQASVAAAASLAASTETTTPDIIFKPQVRIHTELGLSVLADTRSHIHRAFSLWLTLRQQNKPHFSKSEVIQFYAEQTGKTPRNVRRWLAAGENIFWTLGRKKRLSLIGKNSVFRHFELVTPGRVLLVDTEILLGGLQEMRGGLFSLFTAGREKKWISRDTLESVTGIKVRTQQNYTNAINQARQHTFALGYKLATSDSDARQMPNIYYARWYAANNNGQSKARRYNLYMPDDNGSQSSTGITTDKQRLLFDNPRVAAATARQRANKGITGQLFSVLPGPATKHNHLLLRTVDYGVYT